MHLTWDEGKNRENIGKHGLDFADAHEIFKHPMLVSLDTRKDHNEDRWIGIGMMLNRTIVVVYIEPAENMIRIISLRKALGYERQRYEQYLTERFGAA